MVLQNILNIVNRGGKYVSDVFGNILQFHLGLLSENIALQIKPQLNQTLTRHKLQSFSQLKPVSRYKLFG